MDDIEIKETRKLMNDYCKQLKEKKTNLENSKLVIENDIEKANEEMKKYEKILDKLGGYIE